MIVDEFYRIGADAIHEHDFNRSFTVKAVVPTSGGPVVQWKPLRGKRPAPDPEFDHLRPAAVLDALARTLAMRWERGRPLCPLDWKHKLTVNLPRLFRSSPKSATAGVGYWPREATISTPWTLPGRCGRMR